VPIEEKAKIIGGTATPKFAKSVSWKYTHLSAVQVAEDLKENHNRTISPKLVQGISESVSAIVMEKEFEYTYDLPAFTDIVSHISIGLDGTTTPIRFEGYKQSMCGTITL
jgi:hypothetical protein